MTSPEPIRVSVALALAIHDRQIAEHGGPAGLRDRAALESAIARPRQRFSFTGEAVDLPELAAAYTYGLARNHPFLDGNKRTAYVILRTFLLINGWDLVASDVERYRAMVGLASGTLSENDMAEWLRAVVRPTRVSEADVGYR